jgi:hypothetical protein
MHCLSASTSFSFRHVSPWGTDYYVVSLAEEFLLIGYYQNVFECHGLLGKLRSKGVCPNNVILHGVLGKRWSTPGGQPARESSHKMDV